MHTSVQLNLTPKLVQHVAAVTPADMEEVFNILKSGKRGASMKTALDGLTVLQKELYTAWQCTSRRVEGSAASLLSLRSELFSYYDVFEVFSINMTLNPNDLSSVTVFQMSGKDYKFDGVFGTPDTNRPGASERWKTIAANPVACAAFFNAYIKAFILVFLGWEEGAFEQTDPNWCVIRFS